MTRKASKPKPPAFSKGDRVLVRPTAEHPVAVRGKVESFDDPVVTVRRSDGYVVRYREHQLVRA